MAVDRHFVDELAEVSDSHLEKLPENGERRVDGADVSSEITETRTPAEYNRSLRAIVDELDGSAKSADNQGRSAWDDIAASIRPPLDALRIPPERVTHILDGDGDGKSGGHRHGTGSPGKTEFPAHWDDDTTIDIIQNVARSPDSAELQSNGRWKVMGTRDDVRVVVIVLPDGRIWSAYPLPGSPGVRQNPRDL